MGKRRNWEEVGDIIAKIRELGLTYKEGAGQLSGRPGSYCTADLPRDALKHRG